MTAMKSRIVRVELDEKTLIHREPEVERERAVAIYDLLEENRFAWRPQPEGGPYRLRLAINGDHLVFGLGTEGAEPVEAAMIELPLEPFDHIVRNGFLIRESYDNAVRRASPSQIDAIAAGRRALHEEGSQLLRNALSADVDMDEQTARRLFSLLCALHIRR